MNTYYATGAPLFSGPPVKDKAPPYGTVGHLINHLYQFQIKIDYCQNPFCRSQIDMNLIAPDGKTLFVDAKKHNGMREEIYEWAESNGKEEVENV